MPYKPGTLKKAGDKAALAKPNPKLPMYNPDGVNSSAGSPTRRPLPPDRGGDARPGQREFDEAAARRLAERVERDQEPAQRQFRRRTRQQPGNRTRADTYQRAHQRDIPAAKGARQRWHSADPRTTAQRFQDLRHRNVQLHSEGVRASARPETPALSETTLKRVARGASRAASRASRLKGSKAFGPLGLFSEFKAFQSQMKSAKKIRENYKKKGLLPGGST
jgi:hypothetical protein